jgi:hypothetical protein|tara:strand:- start:167 stop:517 length:351 start_codon:yes stop_codon:yes gene_type:complete
MKKDQGNIWECKTRFTFYLSKKDEEKLLNYSVSGKFKSFEKFDLWLLSDKEVLNFFKKAVWTTFHDCKITNLGKPKRAGTQGYVGDKQVFNKKTNAYEIPKKPEINSKQMEFNFND